MPTNNIASVPGLVPYTPINTPHSSLTINSSTPDIDLTGTLGIPKAGEAKSETPQADLLSSMANKQNQIPTEKLFKQDLFKRYKGEVYNPNLYDNEDIFAKNQSVGSKFLRSTVKFGAITGATALSTVAQIPLAVNAIAKGDVSKIYNNNLLKSTNDWLKNIEDSPTWATYYTNEETKSENPLYGVIPGTNGSANFWFDKMFKNAGYMAGMVAGSLATGAALGAIGKAAGSLSKGYSILNKINKASQVAEAGELANIVKSGADVKKAIDGLSNVNRLATTGKTINRALLSYTGAAGEAALNSSNTYETAKTNLLEKAKQKYGNNIPTEELDRMQNILTSSGNTDFALGTAFHLVSNAIQFPSLVKGSSQMTKKFGENVIKTADDDFIKVALNSSKTALELKPLTKGKQFLNAVDKTVLKGFIPESFEEGADYALEQGTLDIANKKYDKASMVEVNDFTSSYANAIKRTFQTKEGLESMIIGGLTGFITGVGGSPVRNLYAKATGQATDAEIAQQKINLFNEDNQFTVLEEVMKSAIKTSQNISVLHDSSVTDTKLNQELVAALDRGDFFSVKNIKDDKLFNAIISASKLGLFDTRIDQLNSLKSIGKEEFEQFYGEDNEQNRAEFSKLVDNVVDRAKEHNANYERINNSIQNPYNYTYFDTSGKTDKELMNNEVYQNNLKYKAVEDIKEELTHALGKVTDVNRRLSELSANVVQTNTNLTNNLVERIYNFDNITERYLPDLLKELETVNQEISTLEEIKDLNTLKELNNLDLQKAKRKKAKIESVINNVNTYVKDNITKNEKGEEVIIPKEYGQLKDIYNTIVDYEINKYNESNPVDLTPRELEDITDYMYDMYRLDVTKKVAIDKYNRLQTTEGVDNYMQQYIDTHKANLSFFKKIAERYSDGRIKGTEESNIDKIDEPLVDETYTINPDKEVDEETSVSETPINTDIITASDTEVPKQDDAETISKQITEFLKTFGIDKVFKIVNSLSIARNAVTYTKDENDKYAQNLDAEGNIVFNTEDTHIVDTNSVKVGDVITFKVNTEFSNKEGYVPGDMSEENLDKLAIDIFTKDANGNPVKIGNVYTVNTVQNKLVSTTPELLNRLAEIRQNIATQYNKDNNAIFESQITDKGLGFLNISKNVRSLQENLGNNPDVKIAVVDGTGFKGENTEGLIIRNTKSLKHGWAVVLIPNHSRHGVEHIPTYVVKRQLKTNEEVLSKVVDLIGRYVKSNNTTEKESLLKEISKFVYLKKSEKGGDFGNRVGMVINSKGQLLTAKEGKPITSVSNLTNFVGDIYVNVNVDALKEDKAYRDILYNSLLHTPVQYNSILGEENPSYFSQHTIEYNVPYLLTAKNLQNGKSDEAQNQGQEERMLIPKNSPSVIKTEGELIDNLETKVNNILDERNKDYSISRLRTEEERGREQSGRINAAATLILERVHYNAEKQQGISNANAYSKIKQLEEAELEKLAKSKGIWQELPNTPLVDNGNESDVYEKDNITVLKVNNANNNNSWLELLDSIALHNSEFPSTSYKILGFGLNKDGEFSIFLQQNKIKGTPAKFEDIHQDLINRGYETYGEYGEGSYINKDKGIIIEDMKEDNVLSDGRTLFYIDTDMYINNRIKGGDRKYYESTRDTDINNIIDKFVDKKCK